MLQNVCAIARMNSIRIHSLIEFYFIPSLIDLECQLESKLKVKMV